MKPRVSVVIPTHNRSAFIGEAIESVLAQTFEDWELVIVDDGSTDETRAVVADYMERSPKVHYSSQMPQGVCAARARGLELASGEYITFLDDDDLFLFDKLEKQVLFLDSNPEIGLVYSYVDFTDGDRNYHHTHPKKPGFTFADLILRGNFIQPNAMMARRACFEEVGGFRADMKSCDDYEMWLRIAKNFKIAFLPEVVGIYRWHGNNLSYQHKRRYGSILQIYREWLEKNLEKQEMDLVRRRLASYSYAQGVEALDQKDHAFAARCFANAVRTNPNIGFLILWARFSNPAYRFLKPYLALVFCGLMAGLHFLKNFPEKGLRQSENETASSPNLKIQKALSV